MTPGLWAGFFAVAVTDDVVSDLCVSGDPVGGEAEVVSAGVAVDARVCREGFLAT